MVNALKRMAEYIGIGLFSLGIIIVIASSRGFHQYVFVTGIFLIIIPTVIWVIINQLTNTQKPKVRHLKDLKKTGIQIPVDLTKCKIKSNKWTTEVGRYNNSKTVFLNEISGHSDKNTERIESTRSRIEYTHYFNDQPKTFLSSIIEKDRTTLEVLLEMQKQTTIYIDRDDERSYYFDIEFIDG